MSTFRFNRLITSLIVIASPILVPVLALAQACIQAVRETIRTFRYDVPALFSYSIVEPAGIAKNVAITSGTIAAFLGALAWTQLVDSLADFYERQVKFRLVALIDIPAVLLELLIGILIEGRQGNWTETRNDFIWSLRGIGRALRTGAY